MQVRLSAEQVM